VAMVVYVCSRARLRWRGPPVCRGPTLVPLQASHGGI
jgi:hypothetical protein